MSLLSRLFGPPKPPVLSCYVQGVIRSLDETPEEWTIKVGCIAHRRLDIKVGSYYLGQDTSVTGQRDVNSDEEEALRAASERWRAWKYGCLFKSAHAHFEPLGCPPPARPDGA